MHINRPTPPRTTSRRARKYPHDPSAVLAGVAHYNMHSAPATDVWGCKIYRQLLYLFLDLQSHLTLRCSPLHHTPTTTSMPLTPKQPITTMLIIPNHPCCLIFHTQHNSTACLNCPRHTAADGAAAPSLGMGPGHASTKSCSHQVAMKHTSCSKYQGSKQPTHGLSAHHLPDQL